MALEELLYELDEDWRQEAACIGADPDLFFPAGEILEQLAAAKEVCLACPVKEACLNYALATNQTEGVWGGLTPTERRRMRRRLMERMRKAS